VIVLVTTARRDADDDDDEESRASIIASHVGAWLPPAIGLIVVASTEHLRYTHYDASRFCFIDSNESIGWPWGLFFAPAMLLALLALGGAALLVARRRAAHVAMALYGLLFAAALLIWCIMRILLDVAGTPVERYASLVDGSLAERDDLWLTGAVAAAVLGVVLVLLLIDVLLTRVRGRRGVKPNDGLDIKATDVLSDRKQTKELKTYKSNDVYDIDEIADTSDDESDDDASLSIRMLDEASESGSAEPPPPAPMAHSTTLRSPQTVTYGKLSEVTRAPPQVPVVYEQLPPNTGTMEMSIAAETPRSTNLYDHMVPRESNDDDDDDESSSDDLVITSKSARASAMPGGESSAIENIIDQLADIVGEEDDDDDDDDINLDLSSTSSSFD
jgi:hypothetical protein